MRPVQPMLTPWMRAVSQNVCHERNGLSFSSMRRRIAVSIWMVWPAAPSTEAANTWLRASSPATGLCSSCLRYHARNVRIMKSPDGTLGSHTATFGDTSGLTNSPACWYIQPVALPSIFRIDGSQTMSRIVRMMVPPTRSEKLTVRAPAAPPCCICSRSKLYRLFPSTDRLPGVIANHRVRGRPPERLRFNVRRYGKSSVLMHAHGLGEEQACPLGRVGPRLRRALQRL